MSEPDGADFSALRRLCSACEGLIGVTGAGITLSVDGARETLVAVSGDLAATVEDLQFSLGEGPSREAYDSGRPVLVPDLAQCNTSAARWPIFADALLAVGVSAIFAFPFGRVGKPIGVLDVFRIRAGQLSEAEADVAQALADIALALLPTAFEGDEMGGGEHRAEVHQATGMVSAQLDVSVTDALVRLRARAFADGRTVNELAADVVERRLRFAKDDL